MKYLSLVLSRTPSAWGVAVGNSKNYFQRHLHSPAHPHKVCQGLEIRPAAGQTPALQGAQDLEAVAENCRHNLPVKPGVFPPQGGIFNAPVEDRAAGGQR